MNWKGSRLTQYLEVDKPALKPLPPNLIFCRMEKSTAGIDYHVAIEKHYYSVPYRFLKKPIDVRISASTIECFHKGERIAIHRRAMKPGHTTCMSICQSDIRIMQSGHLKECIHGPTA